MAGGGTPHGGAWINRTQGTYAHGQLWTSVASDASGARIAATSGIDIPPPECITDGVWTSINGGLTWSAPPQGGPDGAIASNSTGTVLAAVWGGTSGEGVWTSTNSGATWSVSPPTSNEWGPVASDATGTHLAAAGALGDIWTSSDSGATWTNRTPSGSAHDLYWVSLASDSSGANLVAISGGGPDIAGSATIGILWTSSDSGATWTYRTPAGASPDSNWYSVASDSTGKRLVAVGSSIWTSADAGLTWTQQNARAIAGNLVSVASDATGTHLVAASGGVGATGDIWTSADSGVTWVNETAGTSAASQSWRAVASDSTGARLVAVGGGDVWTN